MRLDLWSGAFGWRGPLRPLVHVRTRMDLVLHVRLPAMSGRGVLAVALLALIAARALGRLVRVTLVALVAFLPLAAAPIPASAASATPALLVFVAIGMRSAALGVAFTKVFLNR